MKTEDKTDIEVCLTQNQFQVPNFVETKLTEQTYLTTHPQFTVLSLPEANN